MPAVAMQANLQWEDGGVDTVRHSPTCNSQPRAKQGTVAPWEQKLFYTCSSASSLHQKNTDKQEEPPGKPLYAQIGRYIRQEKKKNYFINIFFLFYNAPQRVFSCLFGNTVRYQLKNLFLHLIHYKGNAWLILINDHKCGKNLQYAKQQ